VDFKTEMAVIFEKIVATRDRYGLHAYLTALDNAGLQAKLGADLKATGSANRPGTGILLEVLRTGALPAEQRPSKEMVSARASSQP
jgi:hypothetical protein